MVRLLDRMEADGVLERRPHPEDRRARRLFLTEKARPVLDEVWRMVDVTRSETFNGVSDADRQVFMRVLEQLHGNLSALTGRPIDDSCAPLAASDPAAAPVSNPASTPAA
jgi:MarR family transcriptional regulator for hemolysin